MLKFFPFHHSSSQLQPTDNTYSCRHIPSWSCSWISKWFWSCHLDVIILPFNLQWLTPFYFSVMATQHFICKNGSKLFKSKNLRGINKIERNEGHGRKNYHKDVHLFYMKQCIFSLCVYPRHRNDVKERANSSQAGGLQLDTWGGQGVGWRSGQEALLGGWGQELVLGTRCAEGSGVWDGTFEWTF